MTRAMNIKIEFDCLTMTFNHKFACMNEHTSNVIGVMPTKNKQFLITPLKIIPDCQKNKYGSKWNFN